MDGTWVRDCWMDIGKGQGGTGVDMGERTSEDAGT